MKILVVLSVFASLLFSEVKTVEKNTKKEDVKINNNIKSDKSVDEYLKEKDKKEDTVLAKVGDVEITQIKVEQQVQKKLQKTFFHKKLSKEKQLEYNKEALSDLIDKELIYAYAKRTKIIIPKEEIEKQLQIILDRFKSKEEYTEALKKLKLTLDDIKKEIYLANATQIIFDEQIKANLTDEYLKNYYEENMHKYLRPESRKTQMITINIDASDKDGFNKAKEKAEEVYGKVKAGESFEEMATKYSEDAYRVKGGNLGYVHKGVANHLDKVVFKVKTGELSELVKDDTSFFFVKVLEEKPEEQVPFKKMKFKIKEDLTKSIQEENLKKIFDEQKKFTKIEKF